MKSEHTEIIKLISTYLDQNPDLRFGQALFNLDVNEFNNKLDPEKEDFKLRDIHGDADADILNRIKSKVKRLNEE